jgi:hypothetical protein
VVHRGKEAPTRLQNSLIRVVTAAIFLGIALLARGAVPFASGWGIDANLSSLDNNTTRARFLATLRAASVKLLGEREFVPATAGLHDAGFDIASYLNLGSLAPAFAGNQLPEDLLRVFHAAGEMERRDGRWVTAWEMVGEGDVGYCTDLPDRVASFQKAVYLGIKSAEAEANLKSRQTPLVLMGALALPPGPWLERAGRNGLLDYTDAYNLHFYGHAGDLAGVIRAHEAFARRCLGARGKRLPVWVTECGMKAVSQDDFLNIQRRQAQADFTVSTAEEALQEPEVAVFMPFILVHHGDPYALTLGPDKPLAAWNAYARLTESHPWPMRPLASPPANPNPVVLQWLPDNLTTVPHKVSGTYRFLDGRPIRGEVRIYNLSSRAVQGRFSAQTPAALRTTFPVSRELTLPPESMSVMPGKFSSARSGYFQAWWHAEFDSGDGARSPLYFGLERSPSAQDFVESPLRLAPVTSGRIGNPLYAGYRVTSSAGPWLGINGVKVEFASESGARFQTTELTGDPVGDPFFPPVAAARVSGLPDDGFLLVRMDRPMDRNFGFRVDLVDDIGQRFTIWENFGQSYFAPSRELWLNLHDFHIYFWGRCSDDPVFRPKRIRELQLRFYPSHAGGSMTLSMALERPRT